ncbi:MAG: response regulator [Phycisphaerales bacterium]
MTLMNRALGPSNGVGAGGASRSARAESAARSIRILCVDDHAVVAKGLRAAFETEGDLEIVAWRPSADGLLEAVDEHRPDVVIIDVDMPGPVAFDAIEELGRLRPAPEGPRCLVLSAFTRDTYIDAAISAGAWGYLSKNDELEAIFEGVRRAHRGEFAFSPAALERCEVVGGRLRLKVKEEAGASRLNALTDQEMQVLRLIARGASTKEVAGAIYRSEKRVEAVRTSIMKKLGCHDRVELTRYAIREGIVEP